MSKNTNNGNEGASVDGEGFVGYEIRRLRKARRMTLAELARRTSMSVGHLSHLERNLSSPTLKTLRRICDALGVNIDWFFRTSAPGQEEYIVRKDRRSKIRFEPGGTDYLLNTKAVQDLELLLVVLGPHVGVDQEYTHDGEEGGMVLAGKLELWIDGESYLLECGDSFSFPSTLPHKCRNPTDEETQVVWFITPATF